MQAPEGKPYPAFVIADTDIMGRSLFLSHFPVGWYFLQVGCGEEALRYYQHFKGLAQGIFVSEGINWSGLAEDETGLEECVRLILDQEKDAPVIVLLELPEAASIAQWKERGAYAVLPHPTRRTKRDELLRQTFEQLTFRFWAGIEAKKQT